MLGGMLSTPFRTNRRIPSLAGRRGLVVADAGPEGAAAVCAQHARRRGARLVLGGAEGSRPQALEAMVDAAARELGGFDFVLHVGRGTHEADRRGRADAGADGRQLRAMRAACQSFSRLSRLCAPHMVEGGALVTLLALREAESAPGLCTVQPLAAAFGAIVRYLAVELEPFELRVHAMTVGPTAAALADEQSAIGDCAAFLVGPAATGLTGCTFHIGGVGPGPH